MEMALPPFVDVMTPKQSSFCPIRDVCIYIYKTHDYTRVTDSCILFIASRNRVRMMREKRE